MFSVIYLASLLAAIYIIALYAGRRAKEEPESKEQQLFAAEGLLTARACAEHFERVVIVESEEWVHTPEGLSTHAWTQTHNRARVVQYHSNQSTQVLSLLALNKLYPTFEEECKASDIRILPADSRTSIWGYEPSSPYEVYNGALPKNIFASRQGFETLLRRLTYGNGAYPNIEWVVGTVTGVQSDPDYPSKLHKVDVRTTEGSQDIDATLVIDCTGTVQAGLRWLKHAGYGVSDLYPKGTLPIEDLKISYDQKLRYSTLKFRITRTLGERLPIPGGFYNVGVLYNCVTDSSKDCHNIYTQRVDGDIIQLCCGAWGDAQLPTTLDGVIEYARRMIVDKPMPDWVFNMMDMLHEVEDSMTCSVVRVIPTSYIQYHRGVNLPSNFIALGDSIMRTNPVWGEGCAKTLLGVMTLNTMLLSLPSVETGTRSHLPSNFAKKFFDIQSGKIGPVWTNTKIFDYAYKTTIPIAGETLSAGSFVRWYLQQLTVLALRGDKQIESVMWHVAMFLAPQSDQFKPSIVLKVLRNALFNRAA